MIYMSKKFLFCKFILISVFLLSSFVPTIPVFAQEATENENSQSSNNATPIGTIKGPVEGDLISFINRITNYIQPLIAVIFLFVIVYGGFVRMTAAGDPEKEKKSTMILTAGIVGFLIIVLAPAIVNLVTSIIGLQSGFV